MARVVMLTAAAGPGLDLQYGDIFETDQATADRLLELGSAREVTPQDKDAPVKRETKPVADGDLRGASEPDGESDEAGDESDDLPAEPAPEPVAAPARRAATRRR